jgi:hypothetical protein
MRAVRGLPRKWPVRAARWALGLVGLVGLACQTSYYEEYRARHPDWDGAFPREGASLEEVLAALHAPATQEGTRITVDAIEIWRVDTEGASRIDFERLRRGETRLEDGTHVAVLALRTCQAERGLETRSTPRVGYYLLPGLRLSAYDHYDFGRVCAVESQFLAARGPALPLEQAAVARIASHYGRVPLDLPQLYRRGLAYLEAGRVRDAQAALTRGEPGFLELEARVRRGEATDAQAVQETARLRAQLMRALGVESRQEATPGPR